MAHNPLNVNGIVSMVSSTYLINRVRRSGRGGAKGKGGKELVICEQVIDSPTFFQYRSHIEIQISLSVTCLFCSFFAPSTYIRGLCYTILRTSS